MIRCLVLCFAVGCLAPPSSDAYVVLDAAARESGVAVSRGVNRDASALPIAVPGGEPLEILTQRGSIHLDPFESELLSIRGPDADIHWHLLGDDIDPDAIRVSADGGALEILTDALDAEIELALDHFVLRAPDAWMRAAELSPIEGIRWTQAVAFEGTEAVWLPDAVQAASVRQADALTHPLQQLVQRLTGAHPPARPSPSDPKPWVDVAQLVTMPCGVRYADTVVGTGALLDGEAHIVVDYQMWVDDGPVADSSISRGIPAKFPFRRGALIKGWEEGLLGMRVGGRRTLVVPSEAGYGARGRPPLISGDAVLTFDVLLLEIEPEPN